MSKHEIIVIKVKEVLECPNADRLSIINVWDYQCVVRKGLYNPGDLCAFVEPDYEVPLDRDEFKSLDEKGNGGMLRITTRKFKKNISYGYLLPAPVGSVEGDNVMELLGIRRWEPKPNPRHRGGRGLGRGPNGSLSGFQGKSPEIDFSILYDLESIQKFRHVMITDEDVDITEKIHGQNARFVFTKDEFFCGSRKEWKMPPGIECGTRKVIDENGVETEVENISPDSNWWIAARQNPWIEEWCRNHPDLMLCGEIYGPNVQGEDFSYGKKDGEIGFAAFDIFDTKNNKFIDNTDFLNNPDYSKGIMEFAPILYEGPLDYELIKKLAEEDSEYTGQSIREGCVIKPYRERIVEKFGRVALKYVSNRYYEVK